jgi:hypothetical protein
MDRIKERKIVTVLSVIGASLMIIWLICLFLMIFNLIFGVGFLLLPIAGVFLILANVFDKKDTYTSQFIRYMKCKLKDARTLEELKVILKEFEDLAIENNMYCLSYPVDIRKIHEEILYKIDILEKNENK